MNSEYKITPVKLYRKDNFSFFFLNLKSPCKFELKVPCKTCLLYIYSE